MFVGQVDDLVEWVRGASSGERTAVEKLMPCRRKQPFEMAEDGRIDGARADASEEADDSRYDGGGQGGGEDVGDREGERVELDDGGRAHGAEEDGERGSDVEGDSDDDSGVAGEGAGAGAITGDAGNGTGEAVEPDIPGLYEAPIAPMCNDPVHLLSDIDNSDGKCLLTRNEARLGSGKANLISVWTRSGSLPRAAIPSRPTRLESFHVFSIHLFTRCRGGRACATGGSVPFSRCFCEASPPS